MAKYLAWSFLIIAVLVGQQPVLGQTTNHLAPLHAARAPRIDADGRTLYLIDLVPHLQDRFPDSVPAEIAARFQLRHSGRAINMAHSLELQYGFITVDMTSWVGDSVSAYLTPGQVDRVRRDPRVTLVTESEPQQFSVPPPWSDYSPVSPPNPWFYEMRSYGHSAMNGRYSVGTGYPRIYLIDSGVGYHQDLQNVVRVAPSGASVVGCYSHATHVAGIINATFGNNGTVGILPGVQITSVSVHYANWASGGVVCGNPYAQDTTSIAAAMDWVKWDLRMSGEYRAGIVNISMSGSAFGPGGTLRAKMLDLASIYVGGYVYLGSFVAQAAGNQLQDACSYAYGDPSASDGIMVVGAAAPSGYQVEVYNGGFANMPYASNEPGSNWGYCVDVWAPGQHIWAAWGPDALSSDPATWQSSSTTYDNYASVGGTSFASPHVTAVAAYLAATQGLHGAGEIETAVRNTMYTANWIDYGGYLIRYPQVP